MTRAIALLFTCENCGKVASGNTDFVVNDPLLRHKPPPNWHSVSITNNNNNTDKPPHVAYHDVCPTCAFAARDALKAAVNVRKLAQQQEPK